MSDHDHRRAGRRHARAARRRGARGFSLIEVLAAFVILALVATALFRLFGDSLRNASAAEDWSRALLVAESRLEEAPGAPWMVAGLTVDVRPLIGEAVTQGGHIRVGLEDAPLGSTMSNLAWVEDAVRLVRRHGSEPATAAEVRQGLQALAAG